MTVRSEEFDKVCKRVADKHCIPLKVVHDIVELQFKTLSDITKKCIPLSYKMEKIGTFLCNEQDMLAAIGHSEGNKVAEKEEKKKESQKKLNERMLMLMEQYNVPSYENIKKEEK